MTNHQINLNVSDPTSTSNSLSKRDMRDAVRHAVHQQSKHLRNSHYGTSLITEQAQKVFKKRVEEELMTFDRSKTFHGRDYRKIQDAFTDAIHAVRSAGRSPLNDYVWYINPNTLNLVKDLYQMFSRMGIPPEVSTTEPLVFQGVEFHSSPSVPEGWVLLANKDRVDGSKTPMHPHPVALIREIDAGFQERVEMAVGGEIHFRVVNP